MRKTNTHHKFETTNNKRQTTKGYSQKKGVLGAALACAIFAGPANSDTMPELKNYELHECRITPKLTRPSGTHERWVSLDFINWGQNQFRVSDYNNTNFLTHQRFVLSLSKGLNSAGKLRWNIAPMGAIDYCFGMSSSKKAFPYKCDDSVDALSLTFSKSDGYLLIKNDWSTANWWLKVNWQADGTYLDYGDPFAAYQNPDWYRFTVYGCQNLFNEDVNLSDLVS